MKIENIKFKAKSIYNDEWVYGDLLHQSDGTHIFMGKGEGGHTLCPRVDPSSVCMFTGLKDCEGKEVWEGDILEGPHKEEICFYQGAFVIHSIGDDTFSSLFNYTTWDGKITCKVIGNKFDKKK